MAKNKKPKGELGSLHVGAGSATYRVEALPSDKESLERWALDNAFRMGRSRGKELYSVIAPPTKNPEDDFDFTLTTIRGKEDLELMEIVLMSSEAGYEAIGTSYNVAAMVDTTVERVLAKSRKYGRPTRRLHLLLYSTDWRFSLPSTVVSALTSELNRQKHVFATITCFDPARGIVDQVFPDASVDSGAPHAQWHRSFVVLGDIRKPEVQPDGSVLVPVEMPVSVMPLSDDPIPELRLWICPALCGCELEILGSWVDPPRGVAGAPAVSYRHPVPGTIRAVAVRQICAAHQHFCSDPPLDETYSGLMSGYLHRSPITDAEKLYVGLLRYAGQTLRPDTCECRIYQTSDRTKPDPPLPKPHPRDTRKCTAHSGDDDNHSHAIENNRRKNEVLSQISRQYSISGKEITWTWDDARRLHIIAHGLSDTEKVTVQSWCDATLGIGKVVL